MTDNIFIKGWESVAKSSFRICNYDYYMIFFGRRGMHIEK
jgi:hypothetical protein